MPDNKSDSLNLMKIFLEVLKEEAKRQAKFFAMALLTSTLLMIPIFIRDSAVGCEVLLVAYGFLLFFHWSLIMIFSTIVR